MNDPRSSSLFTYRHHYPASLLSSLGSMRRVYLPRPLRLMAVLLVAGLLVAAAGLVMVPWVQTTTGSGRVTTLDPRDRVQNISALVSGRIAQWYVRDGQFVNAGDPIVRIEDVDASFVVRLEGQLAAARQKYDAARAAADTAELDLVRREGLFAQGLTSRLEFEQARIRVQQLRASEAEALTQVNQAEVNLSRQGSQLVVAPRDGTIVHVEAGDSATVVSAGQALATFLPADAERAVELFIEGRDIGLVQPGRQVRLEFETWPAFQFSGLPEFAAGTFAGEVVFVEPGAGPNGQFRVLVAEPEPGPGCRSLDSVRPGMNIAGNCGWPPERFIRLGTSTRGWVLLDKVPLGYELWRLMNNFPPGNRAGMARGTSP